MYPQPCTWRFLICIAFLSATVRAWGLDGASEIDLKTLGSDWLCATETGPWQGYDQVALTLDGKLWLVSRDPNYPEVWSSEDGAEWIQVTDDAPWGGIQAFAVTVFDDRMWVLGGSTKSGEHNSAVWYSYNGETWSLAIGSAPWPARMHLDAFSYNGKLWIIGGSNRIEGDVVYYKDIWSSVDGVGWKKVADITPHSVLINTGTYVFDGKIWALKGSEVWSSTNGITWTQHANAPWGGSAIGAVVCENELWAMTVRTVVTSSTGVHPGSNSSKGAEVFYEVWRSPNGSDWTLATDSPPWNYTGFSVTSKDGDLWVLGGRTSTGSELVPERYVWYSVGNGPDEDDDTDGGGCAGAVVSGSNFASLRSGGGDILVVAIVCLALSTVPYWGVCRRFLRGSVASR